MQSTMGGGSLAIALCAKLGAHHHTPFTPYHHNQTTNKTANSTHHELLHVLYLRPVRLAVRQEDHHLLDFVGLLFEPVLILQTALQCILQVAYDLFVLFVHDEAHALAVDFLGHFHCHGLYGDRQLLAGLADSLSSVNTQ
jgi:hypothetical protein